MTDKKYIIALDQGTTSSRAVLLDHNANVVEIAQREFTQIYPRAGWWNIIQWKFGQHKVQH